MAILTVTTLADEAFNGGTDADELADGAGLSLREAIALANASGGAHTIMFDPSLLGGAITLSGTELTISSDITIAGDINGDGLPDITVSGNNTARVFNVTSGTSIVDGVIVTGGNVAGSGGAINIAVGATLTVDNSDISGNFATDAGGIENAGTLTLNNTNVSGNDSTNASAVINNAGTATINNSSIVGNNQLGVDGNGPTSDTTITNSIIAQNDGGGIAASGPLSVTDSIITGNNGVALFTDGDTPVVTDSVITGALAEVNSGEVTFAGSVVLDQASGIPLSATSVAPAIEPDLNSIFTATESVNMVTSGALVANGVTFGIAVDQSGPAAGIGPSYPPVVLGISDVTVTEDVASTIDFSGVTIQDLDTNGPLTVTITATDSGATFTAADGSGVGSGVTASANGNTVTLTGTSADITTYLNDPANITYLSSLNNNTPDTISISASDGVNIPNPAQLSTVTLTPVNDDPTLTGLPSDVAFLEDVPTDFDLSGSTLADVDSPGIVTLTLAATTGTFTATAGVGVSVSVSPTSTLVLSGTLIDINTFLNDASNVQFTGPTNFSADIAGSVTVTLNDGNGSGDIVVGTIAIGLGEVNDFPTLFVDTADPVFTEGGVPVALFSNAEASTGEAGQTFIGFTLTVSNVDNDAGEALIINGTLVPLVSGVTQANGLTFNVAVEDGTASVTASGGAFAPQAFETLVNGIRYINDAISPGAGEREVRIFSVTDSGGTENGGLDTLRFSTIESTVTVNNLESAAAFSGDGDDTVSGSIGDDTLGGGLGADTIEGGSGDDLIFGNTGNDVIDGGDGRDILFNGEGDDTVSGGSGDDTLWAGAGDDFLTGGAGADTFIFGAVAGADIIADFNASEGDTLDLQFAATAFADIAAVQAASLNTVQNGQAGVLIDLGDNNSVFIQGLTVADLATINVVL